MLQSTTQTSASELMVAVENGDTAEVETLIQNLNQRDFVQVLRAVQQLDSALSNYALSWQGAETWGRGTEFPA